MNVLISLPPNAARTLSEITQDVAEAPKGAAGTSDVHYYDSDPEGRRIGSGGGTVWIYDRFRAAHPEAAGGRNVVIHAAGQSRRLPAYAAEGKSMIPVPVMRWAVGERIDQTLLDLQIPLLRRIMAAAPDKLRTLIASGDVLVRNEGSLPEIPDVDVVCFGLWAEPSLACNHGVCFMRRDDDALRLDFMLQKPDTTRLKQLENTHYYLMDIGLWILSDKAMDKLRRRATAPDGSLHNYDLYSQFGCALGLTPSASDPELEGLTVAVVPLPGGEFYHFGTTPQLLSSTLALQNMVADQRRIFHRHAKPNPALFTQNSVILMPLTSAHSDIWVENSWIGAKWSLSRCNVVTGVPENDWQVSLEPGQCLGIVPLEGNLRAVRPYGYTDAMRGDCCAPSTRFMEMPLEKWLADRGLPADRFAAGTDIQQAPLFPVTAEPAEMEILARWMTSEPKLEEGRELWLHLPRMSADTIMDRADLKSIKAQREQYLRADLPALSSNPRSVFYQLDLDDTAAKFARFGLEAPARLPDDEPALRRIRSLMFRSRVRQYENLPWQEDSDEAFAVMREAILSSPDTMADPHHVSVDFDQIVWARSPVRIDLAGGWTDTPPYSLTNGGSVVNVAVELNGQPPLQVFVKPVAEPHIVLRSIDLGASETVEDYAALTDYARVGSPFSLPKAALAVAGFAPRFGTSCHGSLKNRLEAFGAGMEITTLSALPAGSGMGTSSILAATLLGALNDFCGLGWSQDDICRRTLMMEQLLTSGGGWQDQYGGVLQGVKLLETQKGLRQSPAVSWLPEGIFTDPETASCHLLYYTGLTRTAKGILAEIVKRMFLSHGPTLTLLGEMKEHARNMAEAIQRRDYNTYGRLLRLTWEQNKLLDHGTCPPAVQEIVDRVDDLLLGYKLPGAGGGGYLYMAAKDPEAALLVRQRLADAGRGRFAELSVSHQGLKVSRS